MQNKSDQYTGEEVCDAEGKLLKRADIEKVKYILNEEVRPEQLLELLLWMAPEKNVWSTTLDRWGYVCGQGGGAWGPLAPGSHASDSLPEKKTCSTALDRCVKNSYPFLEKQVFISVNPPTTCI